MKILMINVVCGIRSTGRICTDLAAALEIRGHEVKIAYGREHVPEQFQKYAVKIGTDFDVKMHGIKARIFDAAGFGSKRVTKKFIEWVKEYDPDVIHLHNIHGYYINVEVLFEYLQKCGKKIIWTLHDCWAFTGHTAYCDAIDCKKWIAGCHHCPQLGEYPKSYIDGSRRNWKKKKALFTGIEDMTIITPSKWLAGLVKDSFFKEYPVQVIHNGIDIKQFYPMKNDFRKVHGLEGKYIILGVASTWNDMKGYSDFIRLSERLDDTYKMILVGLNEEQLVQIPKKILGIQKTASVKELSYIYNAADLFVNLTYCDNYPTVDIEAMACGTPVLTYDTGGSTEIVKKYGGLVVQQGNIEAVADAIQNGKERLNTNHFVPEENDSEQAIKHYLQQYTSKMSGGGYWLKKQSLGLIGKYVVLGVAAIWDKRKGLEDFVKLGKLLSNEYQIIVAGLNEQQKEQLPDYMIGITKTNSVQELAELYSVADVFVNPTYEDNYPTTNLEAIACGTPVITYDTGGSGESALLYGEIVEKDVLKLAKAIQSKDYPPCLNNADFDCKKTVQKYLEIYTA